MSEREDLLKSFAAEAHRRCAAIASTVSMIELGQGPPSGLADAAFEAHALRGAAGALELSDIAESAGKLEDELTAGGEAAAPDPAALARVSELTAAIEDQTRAVAEAD